VAGKGGGGAVEEVLVRRPKEALNQTVKRHVFTLGWYIK